MSWRTLVRVGPAIVMLLMPATARAQDGEAALWALRAEGALAGVAAGIALGHAMGGYAQISQGAVVVGTASLWGLLAADRVPIEARNEAAVGALTGAVIGGLAGSFLTAGEHEAGGRLAHGITGGLLGMVAGGVVAVALTDRSGEGGPVPLFGLSLPF